MTEPAAPAPAPAPVATRNPAAMLLGLIGAVLTLLGAFLHLVSGGPESSGLEAPIEVLWSTELGEPSFFASVGFVLIVVAAITLIGTLMGRNGLTLLGGILGIIVFVLIAITFMRTDFVEIGLGDFGIGMWSILVGGVLAVIGAVVGRRSRA